MKHPAARPLHLAIVLMLSCPLLFAQTPTPSEPAPPQTAPPQAAPLPNEGTQETVLVPRLKTPAEAGPPSSLSASLKREIVPGRKLTIVTQDKPLLRQTCKVEQFDAEKLVCRGKSGPTTYREQDLVAVIAANREFGLPRPFRFIGTLGIGGGALAGAALLSSIPIVGIPLAVVGGILLINATVEGLDSGGTGPRERLLYLNPGQRLQIDLK